MRPKPLIPTRMVTSTHLLASSRRRCAMPASWYANPRPARWPGAAAVSGEDVKLGLVAERLRPYLASADEHVRGNGRFGIWNAQIAGALICESEQPPDPPGDGVFGQRRVGERAELLERRLAVLQPQRAGA